MEGMNIFRLTVMLNFSKLLQFSPSVVLQAWSSPAISLLVWSVRCTWQVVYGQLNDVAVGSDENFPTPQLSLTSLPVFASAVFFAKCSTCLSLFSASYQIS